jgi:glutamate/aspartate transport system substrate-binding protein
MIRGSILVLSLLLAAGPAHSQSQPSRLKKIASAGVITIAYRADATPFSFVDETTKEIGGFSIDLCKRVVALMGNQLKTKAPLQIKWHPVNAQTRLEAVAKGQADMECGSTTVTLARMKEVDFSSYIFVDGTGLMTRASTGVRSASDLNGKRISVVGGTTNDAAVRAHLKERQIAATVVPFKTRDEAFAAMEEGKTEAFASDRLLLLGATEKTKDPKALVMLPDELSFEPYGIALPRGDAELRLAVNTALAQIYRTGEIKEIFGKWFRRLGEPTMVTKVLYILGSIPE